MSEEFIQKIKKFNRCDLEKFAISLWDDLTERENENLNDLFDFEKKKEKANKYINHLESEDDRLTRAVGGMYQDIKMKTLRFFIDAKPTDEQRDIFANLFKNYLK